MVAKAAGTLTRAGCATTAPEPARPGLPPSITVSTADDGEEAADREPGDGAPGGQPAPPDAQQQQRAERGGGDGEGELDRVRDRESLRRAG